MRKRIVLAVMAWMALGFPGTGHVTPALYAAPAPEVKVEARTPLISINKAGSEELQNLRGIGPSLAARIVKYREEHGPFQKVEDLTNVGGIGEGKFQKMKDQVTL